LAALNSVLFFASIAALNLATIPFRKALSLGFDHGVDEHDR